MVSTSPQPIPKQSHAYGVYERAADENGYGIPQERHSQDSTHHGGGTQGIYAVENAGEVTGHAGPQAETEAYGQQGYAAHDKGFLFIGIGMGLL
jgi:hypothetical protein